MRNTFRGRVLAILAALAVSYTVGAAGKPDDKLHLTTVALPPLGSTAEAPGFLEQVAREAFRRVGRDVDVATLPGDRALLNADSGLDDGDLMRAPGFEQAYPNLRRVPEKMGVMDFMAYTNRPDIHIREWGDLAPYTVGYTAGWKIYERKVAAREITTTRSIDGLFPLLVMKRVDVALIDRWQGLRAARMHGGKFRLLEPPLATSNMFMYLHKKHAAMIPAVARALAGMKADGTYQKIFNATLRPYEKR
jgi:polar amino acid transport system substrate-binding protein